MRYGGTLNDLHTSFQSFSRNIGSEKADSSMSNCIPG